MSLRTRLTAVTLAFVAFPLAACSSGVHALSHSLAITSGASPGATTGGAARSAGPTDKPVIDPCYLLRGAEVNQVVGQSYPSPATVYDVPGAGACGVKGPSKQGAEASPGDSSPTGSGTSARRSSLAAKHSSRATPHPSASKVGMTSQVRVTARLRRERGLRCPVAVLKHNIPYLVGSEGAFHLDADTCAHAEALARIALPRL